MAKVWIDGREHEVDGAGGPALCMPAGDSHKPASHETVDARLHYVKQDGQTVFKFAVRKTEEISRRLLERNGLKPGQRIEVEARDTAADAVTVRGNGRPSLTIGTRAASKLLVEFA